MFIHSQVQWREAKIPQLDGFGDSESDEEHEQETANLDDSWGRSKPSEMTAANAKSLSAIFESVAELLKKVVNHTEEVFFNKKCKGKLFSDRAFQALLLQKNSETSRVEFDFSFYSSIVGAYRGLQTMRKLSQNEGFVFGSEKCMTILNQIVLTEARMKDHHSDDCELPYSFYSIQMSLLKGYKQHIDNYLQDEKFTGHTFKDPCVTSECFTPVRKFKKSLKMPYSPTTQLISMISVKDPPDNAESPVCNTETVTENSEEGECSSSGLGMEITQLSEKRSEKSLREFLMHHARHHASVKRPKGETAKCPFCEASFKQNKNMLAHIRGGKACSIIKKHIKTFSIPYNYSRKEKEKSSCKVGDAKEDLSELAQAEDGSSVLATAPPLVRELGKRKLNFERNKDGPISKKNKVDQIPDASTIEGTNQNDEDDLACSEPADGNLTRFVNDEETDNINDSECSEPSNGLNSFVNESFVDDEEDTDACNSIQNVKEKLQDGYYEIPQWILEIDPNFKLGKLLNDSLMSKILFDADTHNKYVNFLSPLLSPVREQIMKSFCEESVQQLWDKEEEINSRLSNINVFSKQLKIEIRHTRAPEKAEPIAEDSDMYSAVKTTKQLKKNFLLYLDQKKAKDTGVEISKKTKELYKSAVFSESRPLSFLNWCRKNDKEPWLYMFNPDGGYYDLPENLDEIVSFKNGSQSASSAKNICNGVQCLIQFFLKASKSYKIPADEDYRFLYLRNKYQESVEKLAESLKTVNTSLDIETKNVTQSEKRKDNFLDPDEAEKQKKGFERYFRGKG